MGVKKLLLDFKYDMRYIRKQIPYIVNANEINCFLDVPAKKNRVNIYDYRPDKFGYDLYNGSRYNLGDSLGGVICSYLLKEKGIEVDKEISKTKHLFTVGSNIFGSSLKGNYQSATIWGSGLQSIPRRREAFCQRISRRKLDIRAVRGPLTKDLIEKFGHRCPEVYGDPAILMPLIYKPDITPNYKYSVVLQFYHERKFREVHPHERVISMNTNDYKSVIDEICASEIIYTSSLHGIILAETYGIPAVFFRGLEKAIDFKYKDWYLSTGRSHVPFCDTFEDAIKTAPPTIPQLEQLQQGLLDSFPYDLWEC